MHKSIWPGTPKSGPNHMTVFPILRSTGAEFPPLLRLWILPFLAGALILADAILGGLNSAQVTMIAALFIVIVGIPHGTLDVEIASARFGKTSVSGKIAILAGYLACAAGMTLCWMVAPTAALSLFLIISIIHFGLDWRGGADPFLAMMVGWALIAMPALSHPQQVSDIFALLTGSPTGSTISALLACAAAPAALGSLVFAFWALKNNERQNAVDVIACMAAAIFLPPLVAFAVFFCGLHSPRHMAEALRDSAGISSAKKGVIIAAVFLLSLAIGVLLFLGQGVLQIESGVIRTAFVLISILTVPHFILEHWKR
jgi:Brp/Blh family beta-carotene 15,15'-monooxygenase